MLNTLRTRLQDRTAHEDGFTLLEVSVAAGIVSVLVAIGFPVVLSNRASSHDDSVRANLASYSVAMADYWGEYGVNSTADINAPTFNAVKHSDGNHFAVTSQGAEYCIFGYSDSGEHTKDNPIVITEKNITGTGTCPLTGNPGVLVWN